MRRDYDVFERFGDGSTLWRATVSGRYEAQRRMHELEEHSTNDFFLINVQVDESLSLLALRKLRPSANAKVAHG
jgi:hypothetical protein